MFLAALLIVSLFTHLSSLSWAAEEAPAFVESIQVTPGSVMPGVYPNIVANIKMRSTDPSVPSLPVNVIAVLTQPDHRTKSWVWSKVILAPGVRKTYTVPKDYPVKQVGEYRIEFTIYSSDMKRRINRSATKFMVGEKPLEAKKDEKAVPAAVLAPPEKKKAAPLEKAGYGLGIGIYGNTGNPAGGATVLIWPGKYVGLQASYTVGEFTSSEARLLGRIVTSSGWNPYLGVGYLKVSKTADVIGVSTTFTDSTVSGVVGIEVPLSRRFYGYVELAGSGIDLKKIVTNGGQTAEATVEYSPVSIGVGLVFALF